MNKDNKKLKLRLLEDSDVKLMEVWLNKEHIRKWYDIPGVCSTNDWLNEIKNRNDDFAFITHFIAIIDDVPIGFCQFYECVHGNEDWYGDIPVSGTYSIDYLIGEEEFIGKGLGKSIIALLIQDIFAFSDSERIIVQPDEENSASNNALLSNGFAYDSQNKLYIISKQVFFEALL